jgi:hypothetical protein
MPLNASIGASLDLNYTGTGIGNAVPQFTKFKASDIILADGTGSGQAAKVYSSVRTLATNTTEDLDMAGSLTDPLGVAVTFATIKAVVIRSDAANTTNLTLFGDANSVPILGAAAHTIVLRPGGAFVWVAPQTGVTVTAGTGDIIQVANAAGASATYSIEIIGT